MSNLFRIRINDAIVVSLSGRMVFGGEKKRFRSRVERDVGGKRDE